MFTRPGKAWSRKREPCHPPTCPITLQVSFDRSSDARAYTAFAACGKGMYTTRNGEEL